MNSVVQNAEACLDALAAFLPPSALLRGDNIPVRNTADTSFLPPICPLAVARPNTPQGVADVLRVCAEYGVAVVPQGGLTGLAGGAHPIEGALALSLERLQGIEDIDPAMATMTVYAGTPLETIQQAAADAGFFIPLDLGARGSCTIGGNLATNAGGNRVIRYGMTREMVLGIEVALADGTLMTSLNKMIKNNAGYDLKQMFIGAEGTLGIITRVVLKLQPAPGCVMAALCGVDDYKSVVGLLMAARQGLGPLLSAFEVMWSDYWHAATERVKNVRKPIEGKHAFYVLIEAQGLDEAIDSERFQAWLERQIEGGLIADAAIAQSQADMADFWRTRDACGEFQTVLGPHCAFDIGLPVKDMDRFVVACRAALEAQMPGMTSVFYGHIGDGNLHIVALREGLDEQPSDEINRIVYEVVRGFGGTVSAEHGIGTVKKAYLSFTRSAQELALMATLKHALDPKHILNPGKIIDMPLSGL